MTASKPFSQSCENNREPILKVLEEWLVRPGTLLEIGSGTGQHAAYMAPALHHVIWQTSDRATNLPGIRQWLADAMSHNLPSPIELDVNGSWPATHWDYLFTANTFHIMAQDEVAQCIARAGERIEPRGRFCVYGPFNIDGKFTSDSNVRFNDWLAEQASHMGIRDLEWVDELMATAGLQRIDLRQMPANNLMLCYARP